MVMMKRTTGGCASTTRMAAETLLGVIENQYTKLSETSKMLEPKDGVLKYCVDIHPQERPQQPAEAIVFLRSLFKRATACLKA
mgnify:CR=1 FL=1